MKTRLLFTLCVMVVPTSTLLAAPVTSRRTVVDYFRLLPSHFFVASDKRILPKKVVLRYEDPQKNYLKFAHDESHFANMDVGSFLEIAVFRFRGRDLIALSATYPTRYSFGLWRYEKRKWRNVTNALSPVADNIELHFVLPRNGTTIRLFAKNGQPHAKLLWENGRFRAERQRVTSRH